VLVVAIPVKGTVKIVPFVGMAVKVPVVVSCKNGATVALV